MGYYRKQVGIDLPPLEQRWRLSPAWYGLGCFFALLIPGLSFLAGMVIVQQGVQRRWFTVPPDLIMRQFPDWLPWHDPYIPAYAVAGLGIGIVLYALLALVYAFIYRMFGGSPYTPFDVVD